MSRGVFNSNNKTIQSVTFQTTSNSATTFDPQWVFTNGRAVIDWGDGTPLEAITSFPSHTYSDSGDVKTVTVKAANLSTVRSVNAASDNVYGFLDLTKYGFPTGTTNGITFSNNSQLSGVSFPNTYGLRGGIDFQNCNLTGNLDLSNFKILGTTFASGVELQNNPLLTGVTFGPTGSITLDCRAFLLNDCDITGTLDLSALVNLTDDFSLNNNTNLTNVIHTSASTTSLALDYYNILNTGIINHDMSGLYNIGGTINIYNNSSLSALTFPSAVTKTLNTLWVFNNNLKNTLDLSMFQNISNFNFFASGNDITEVIFPNNSGNITLFNFDDNASLTSVDFTPFSGTFISSASLSVSDSPSLTAITFSPSFSGASLGVVDLSNNDSLSEIDLSTFVGVTNANWVDLSSSTNLSAITFPQTNNSFRDIRVNSNTSLGSVDLSPVSGFTSRMRAYSSSNLSAITFPYSTGTFSNAGGLTIQSAFALQSSNIGYIDFKPLSGATFCDTCTNGATIRLSTNNLSSADVNHVLVDLDLMCNTLNPSGWSGGTLIINGNAAPDGTSGGFDGLTAINNLTGGTNNWTIAHD